MGSFQKKPLGLSNHGGMVAYGGGPPSHAWAGDSKTPLLCRFPPPTPPCFRLCFFPAGKLWSVWLFRASYIGPNGVHLELPGFPNLDWEISYLIRRCGIGLVQDSPLSGKNQLEYSCSCIESLSTFRRSCGVSVCLVSRFTGKGKCYQFKSCF